MLRAELAVVRVILGEHTGDDGGDGGDGQVADGDHSGV